MTRPLLRRRLADFGPGLILAATGIGVGDMVAATIAGAEYGMTLLWALAAGVLVKFVITEGGARWQLATNVTLMEGWRDHLPRIVLVAFFLYFVIWSYVVSSALVAASALVPAALVPEVSLPAWGFIHAVAGFLMVYFGRYGRILAVMKWLIAVMFVSVLTTVLFIIFGSGANWSALASRSDFSVAYVLSLIGGIGGTVTLLSYGYWMREEGWTGPARVPSARADLTLSFSLVFLFSLTMIFLSTQVEWAGRIVDEGPRLCLLLADRIGAETGPIGRAMFLVGFWGAAFSSVVGVWDGVPFLFDDWLGLWRRRPAGGRQSAAYRAWAAYLTLAAISALVIERPVWLLFVYTIVGSLFFPFVIATLLWLNNSRLVPASLRSGAATNVLLGAALGLYLYLGIRSALW